MMKYARGTMLLTVLVIVAFALAACGPSAAPPPPPTLEPSPTPPPIPTDIATEVPEAAEAPEIEVRNEQPDGPSTTDVAGDAGIIVYSSVKGGSMGLHTLAGTGYHSAPLDVEGQGVSQVIWPEVSPDGERLAFVSVEGSAEMRPKGIYVASVDGSDSEQITFGDGTHPRWSPDGTQLAYTCNGGTDICVIGADGEGQVNLTEGEVGDDAYPDWTPDGRIVFMSNRDAPDGQARDIFLMNADGSDIRNLTGNTADDAYPSVSPDGTKIAFTSDRDVRIGTEIYVLESRSGLVRRVTVDDLWNQTPLWAPDNQTILFAAPDSTGSVNLYTIGERAVTAKQMTENPAEDGGLRLGQTWLPEAVELDDPVREDVYDLTVELPAGSDAQTDLIVLAANNSGCSNCLETGIYTVNRGGDNLEALPVEGAFPAWSPDFTRLAYTRDGELFVANADGSDPVQVTQAFMNLGAIDWNDEGDMIVADCKPYSQYDVCIVDMQQGAVSNITGALTPDTGVRYPWWWGEDIVAGTQVLNQAGMVIRDLPAPARVSPDGDRLAMVVDQQMAVTNLEGREARTVSDGPATKAHPIWSPAGDRILYTVAPGDGRLYLNIARTDGNYAYRLFDQAISAGPRNTREPIETYYGYSWGD